MTEFQVIWKDFDGNKHTWKMERPSLAVLKADLTYWPDLKEIVEIWQRIC